MSQVPISNSFQLYKHRCRRNICKNICAVQSSLQFPAEVKDIREPSAVKLLEQLRLVEVPIPSQLVTVPTAHVPPTNPNKSKPPLLLLHGFDSSSLEFRRLKPVLDLNFETWAIDLLGWGFSDHHELVQNGCEISPQTRREHLFNFFQLKINRPMVVLGVSLGGAAAIDLAYNYPSCVEKLVLVDSQAYTDGIGMMSSAPKWLSMLGIKVLKSQWLRQSANKMAYYNIDKYATADARNIGALHTYLPSWEETNYLFMQSGGYQISSQVSLINQQALVIWGEQDKILDKKFAYQFQADLKSSQLKFLQNCGHCPHLEKPHELAQLVVDFVSIR
eukprot:TRINITY_DN5273_c0_g2_i1.p1 TRINITY_DN5273_c0_g2~~TRINITY_DN5273_c0_g2_i1.p1  ORF type:complete len:332 (+),score=44.26 TRINITY_DN5273_c0_g2_i1:97-1092(+)